MSYSFLVLYSKYHITLRLVTESFHAIATLSHRSAGSLCPAISNGLKDGGAQRLCPTMEENRTCVKNYTHAITEFFVDFN